MSSGVAGEIPETGGGALRLPQELVARSGFLLVRLGLAFKARALEELAASGFSQYQYSVLALVNEQPQETQAQIADILRLDRSQLVRILDGLEDRGLIARQRDKTDRRRQTVSVTPAGRRQLRRLREMTDQLEEDLLAPLDEADRRTLHALLLRLADAHDPGCAGLT